MREPHPRAAIASSLALKGFYGTSAEALARRVSVRPETPRMQMRGYAVAATVTMPCRRAPMPTRPRPPPRPAAHQLPYGHRALRSSSFASNPGEQGHQVTRAVSAMSPAPVGKRPSAPPLIRCVTWLAGQGTQRACMCRRPATRQGRVRRGPGPGARASGRRRQVIRDRSAAPATRRASHGSRPLSPIALRHFRRDDGYETRPTVENQQVCRACVHRAPEVIRARVVRAVR